MNDHRVVIEAQIHAVRQRRTLIEFLLDQLPSNKSNIRDDVSSRFRNPPRKIVSPEPPEFSFTPEISETSRQLASKLARPAFYAKKGSTVSAKQAPAEKKQHTSGPVTEAIAAKIRKKFGSVDAYHAARKSTKNLSWTDLVDREAKELEECTFKPNIKTYEKQDHTSAQVKNIPGLEEFVQRQEKARKLLDEPPAKNGYTGKPTKPILFSFLKKPDKAASTASGA